MIIINPGAGPIKGTDITNAVININKFVEDCNLPRLKVKDKDAIDNGDGRYSFELEREGFPNWSCNIEMPGIPLEKVRYLGLEGQNIWHYPRLYVDGSSYVWEFALLSEEDFKDK